MNPKPQGLTLYDFPSRRNTGSVLDVRITAVSSNATSNSVREWRHSDLRDVAFLHQSKLWEQFVLISENQ
jgi:hypothetical protein